MNEAEILSRARAGEDSRTELKHVDPGLFPESEDVAKELVAFANSGGGEVFFGIDDSGTVHGVGGRKDADALQRHVLQIASGSITPPLSLRLLAAEVTGKLVLVASVPKFLPERPFRGKSKYFIRDGSISREARPDELKRLLASAPIHYFDEEVVDTAPRSALDDEAIAGFLRMARAQAPREQAERYLQAFGAVDPERGTPTVTGIVLFGRDPRSYLPGAYVSARRFAGRIATSAFEDSAEIGGNVFDQIKETAAFLARTVPMPSAVTGIDRVSAGVPLEVWREAVTNALTHRDYASPNQVRVFVFEDRVEIINPGTLLNQLTVESIRLAGTKQPRNPHIASAVAQAAQRDNIGIGVPEIFRLVAERGLPEPQIRLEAGEFRLTVFTRA